MGYTVKQLRSILAQYPDELIVLVDGYEDGYSDIGAIRKSQVELNKNDEDWLGPHAHVKDGGQPVVLLTRAPNPNAL